MYKAISYTLIFLGIQLLVASITTFGMQLWGNEELSASPYVQLASMIVFSLLSALLFIRMKWAVPSRHYLLSRPWLTVFWALMAAVGTIIPSIAVQEYLPTLPNLVETEMGAMMSAKGGYFVICLLVPLVEELVFRGAVLRALLSWKPEARWGMIAVSALLFSIAHMNPAQMPHAFLVGLLLGWMYCRTSSIVPGVAFHWANNTISYFLFKLYPNTDTKLVDVLGSPQHVALAVCFSLFILLPALYQLHLWMRKAQ